MARHRKRFINPASSHHRRRKASRELTLCPTCHQAVEFDDGHKLTAEALTALGFVDYGDYLSSRKWMKIRTEVMRRWQNRCVACGGLATQVHHRKYSEFVLAGKDHRWLVPLCRDCHRWVEQVTLHPDFRGNGRHEILVDELLVDCIQEHIIKLRSDGKESPMFIAMLKKLCRDHRELLNDFEKATP